MERENKSKKRHLLLSLSHILKHESAYVSGSAGSAISPHDDGDMVVGNVVSVSEDGCDNQGIENQMYCSYCCKNVTDMNFLIRMKHVKQCSDCVGRAEPSNKENGRPSCVSEESALRYWLKYNGFEEVVFDVMKAKGVSLKDIGRMDPQKAVELIGLKKQRKKMMIAMEQYRQKGCIPLSTSKLNRNSQRKSRSGNGDSLRDRFKRFRGDVDTNKQSVESRTHASSLRDTARETSAEYCRNKNGMVCSGIARQRQIELALCSALCAVLPRMEDGKSLCIRDETSMMRRHGGLMSKYMICEKKKSIYLATANCSNTGGETVTLEQRLEKRQGAGISGQPARRNSVDASNSLIIKKVRLKALEDELVVQKATVCHLEELIRDLKKEIDCDS